MTFPNILKTSAFYALVAVIIVISVFPFYYAILTSLKSGTALFQINYWPRDFSFANYSFVLGNGSFLRNLGNSLMIASSVVVVSLFLAVTASYALARVRFRGRALLLLTILSVSMFPQIAVLAGLFELIRWAGIFNTPLALIFSYMIFTLPFTVWVLTTFMRDLPIEIEEAAIVDGATPWVIITHAPDVACSCDHRLACLHRGMERVPFRAHLHVIERAAHGACGDCAPVGRLAVRNPLGQYHGGIGDCDCAACHPCSHLSAADRIGSDGRWSERIGI